MLKDLISAHPRLLNILSGCPIHKRAIFVLMNAAQGFAARTGRDRKAYAVYAAVENPRRAPSRAKGVILWMDSG